MALNARKVPSNNNKDRVEQEPIEAGSYPARVVQILDLGLQPQRPFEGEDKPPAHEIMMTYEFLDEFIKDENGEDVEDKPRWLSETFPFRSLDSDLAKSTKRYRALDPEEVHEGDFTALVETPCTVTVVNNAGKGKNAGKVYNNIAAVSAMRPKDARTAPALVNEPKVFVLDEPDLTVFLSLPQWLQDKIKANLEYEGSTLQEALEAHQDDDKPKGGAKPQGKPKKPAKATVEAQDDDDDVEGKLW